MQYVSRLVGAAAVVACCTYASAASANAKHVGHDFNRVQWKDDSHPQSGGHFPEFHWWDCFKKGPSHPPPPPPPPHGNPGDCKVPEIPTSGLPAMAVVVFGGVAIVLSRKTRGSGE